MMKKIRYGMVGGGTGSFIGSIHRAAAALDGCYELVCGAFSSDRERGLESAAALGLPAARSYPDYVAMLAAEAVLPADQRMELVVIVTPNHLHVPVSIAALRAGYHVVCDKPAAMTLAEVRALADVVRDSNRLYALTYTYAGYPMVEEARVRIARGDLGTIRRIDVRYRQGWLSDPIEKDGHRQAGWRTDPAYSGLSCCLGDIGVHAFHLAEHVTGMQVQALSADLATHVAGRRLDDDAGILLRFANGARGTLVASQICCGEENDVSIHVYGDRGGLSWSQNDNESLMLKWPNRPQEIVRMGGPGSSPQALARCRLPAGHHNGYIEAFANHYRAVAGALAQQAISVPVGEINWFPGIEAGVRSLAFIETALANSNGNQKWSEIES